jgi:hypothetical protein
MADIDQRGRSTMGKDRTHEIDAISLIHCSAGQSFITFTFHSILVSLSPTATRILTYNIPR